MSRRLRWSLLGFGTLAVLLLAPWFGAERIDVVEALRQLRAGEFEREARVFALRWPRIVFGFVAGATLGVVGACYQTLLRNALATPYTLGVSFAGALGAFVALSTGLHVWRLGPIGSVELFAFLFAAGDILLLDRLARRGRGLDPGELLLAGVTLNFFCAALIMLLRFLADPFRLRAMDHWMMGSVQLGSAAQLAPLPILLLPSLCYLLLRAPTLDQLAFGDELAASRGVDVGRSQRGLLLVGALATAAVVALSGPIGFVGLLAPHTARRLLGPRHRALLPASLLVGGSFLVLADLLARSLQILGRGAELPVGVVTAMVGAPLFLVLLSRART